jgi:hypothetical protein
MPGHRCRARIYCLTGHEDSDDEFEDCFPDSEQPREHGKLSLMSAQGLTGPQQLRLLGYVKRRIVHILVDPGATHNFINRPLANSLGLAEVEVPPLEVTVADCSSYIIKHAYKRVPIAINEFSMHLDFYPFRLPGVDAVLGLHWLRLLGTVCHDWANLTMSFTWHGKEHNFKGLSLASRREPDTSTTQGTRYGLLVQNHQEKTNRTINAAYQDFRDKYPSVFSNPTGLPPARAHDHRIPLLHGAPPANVRPYRYPQIQKEEIEHAVQEMLQSGIIRHSVSAFSSLLTTLPRGGTNDGGLSGFGVAT